jgi:hypothetical protein
MAKAATRQAKERATAPPLTAMQRLADLTRRIVAVPKSELPVKQKGARKKRTDHR